MIEVFPATILQKVSEKVISFNSAELKALLDKLFAIMHDRNGAGLAAPQIGVSKRVFVYGFDGVNPRYPDQQPVAKSYAINPEITWYSPEKEGFEEGCLSFPGLRANVLRSKSIVYTFNDISGTHLEREVSGFEARIIQHETDHLNGVLLPFVAKELSDADKIKFGLV